MMRARRIFLKGISGAAGLALLLSLLVAAFGYTKFPSVSGTGPAERRLLGPQTSGREYRNLSEPRYEIDLHENIRIPMRDGRHLMADLYRPRTNEKVPVLLAVSPYPRQAMYLGIPAAFVEAGQTDFWVPRGYAHLIVNVAGTFGSEGRYRIWDPEQDHDLYDMIEWAAARDWCDGNAGMIGVSYFAIEQFHAALERPPHLRAIFPFSATLDPYRQIAWHGGIFQGRFLGSYFNAIGMLDQSGAEFFRGYFFRALNNSILRMAHGRFEKPLPAPMTALESLLADGYAHDPWEINYQDLAVEHQLYDDFWKARDLSERVAEIKIPMYMGSDWMNVAVHLDSPFIAFARKKTAANWRAVITPRGGLQWPWESLHVEALAWYDHWLKGRDTGILDGPRFRYFVDGANEWRATDEWPLPDTRWTRLSLGADGTLGSASTPGARAYLHVPATVRRGKNTIPAPLPDRLVWESSAVPQALELVGPLVLSLRAASTAIDTDFIVKLSDLAPDGGVVDLTQGWLRASHRALDPAKSTAYRPYHPHDRTQTLIPGARTEFEIAMLPVAYRFAQGHRIRLTITSHDRDDFAMQGQAHDVLGIQARNTIFADSTLLLPVRP